MTNSTGRLPAGESASWNFRHPSHRHVEPLAVALHRRVAELDGRTGDLPDHGSLDDPIGDGLGERVVDHHVAEELPLLVLGRS